METCITTQHVNLNYPKLALPALSAPGIMVNLTDVPTPPFGTQTQAACPHVAPCVNSIEMPLLSAVPPTAMIGAAAGKALSKRSPAAAAKSREELLTEAAKLKYFVIVMEQKGGVGKSISTVVTYETLKIGAESEILLIDADVVNKNLSRAGLTKSNEALNAGRIDFEGFLYDAAERLIAGEVGGVVIDSAAGGEEHFRHVCRLRTTATWGKDNAFTRRM